MEENSGGGPLKMFSLRDGVILVGLSVVATFLLRVQQSFSLVPSWRYEVTTGFSEESSNMKTLKKLPVPLVADIESDGQNEILLATKDPSLMLLRASKLLQESKALPYLSTLDEFSLLSSGEDAQKDRRRPVAMATGYLEPLVSKDQVRKQVIVVLCADWTVMCLNSDFKLLWTASLSNASWSQEHVMSEAAVLILPHSLRPGDDGLIIVGARISDRHLHRPLRHSHNRDQEGHGSHTAKKAGEETQDVGHFSTFALSGRHGNIRWHHLPGDFEEVVNTEEELFKGVHFKLNLRKGWGHRGEVKWSQYSQALLDQMPFRWLSSADTKIEIADFRKDGLQKNQKEDEQVLSVSNFLTSSLKEHVAGHHSGDLPPHSAAEHVKNPTAIVIHSSKGIEVLELRTGRPLTRLSLSATASYADVNKDGTLDQAQAQFTESGDADNCVAVVRSGHPPHSVLYNGSICYPSSLWAAMSYPWAYITGKADVRENRELSLPPLVLESVAKRRGFISHLLGLSMAKPGMDMVFVASNGRVTSYGPQGQFNWQVSTAAIWTEHHIVSGAQGYINQDLQNMYHLSFTPSIQLTSLQEYSRKSSAVIAGWDSLVLLSLETGAILAEHSLPCQPTAPLIVGDFNNDGWNDVVVQCMHSYLGFSLQQQSRYWATAAVGLAVVVIVTALASTCMPDDEPTEGAAEGHEHHR
ncbi:uncharacterized protein [Diadema setosum]|uniref:uncharacterized protein n=1 Tax=Diadema setosum TaxID=31175 RepID=UPI003B3A41CC